MAQYLCPRTTKDDTATSCRPGSRLPYFGARSQIPKGTLRGEQTAVLRTLPMIEKLLLTLRVSAVQDLRSLRHSSRRYSLQSKHYVLPCSQFKMPTKTLKSQLVSIHC